MTTGGRWFMEHSGGSEHVADVCTLQLLTQVSLKGGCSGSRMQMLKVGLCAN